MRNIEKSSITKDDIMGSWDFFNWEFNQQSHFIKLLKNLKYNKWDIKELLCERKFSDLNKDKLVRVGKENYVIVSKYYNPPLLTWNDLVQKTKRI